MCGHVCSFHMGQIEDCPVGGASPINHGSMPTEMVLQQKNRCSELETWQPLTSEGGCLEGKEEDQGLVERRHLGGGASNCG